MCEKMRTFILGFACLLLLAGSALCGEEQAAELVVRELIKGIATDSLKTVIATADLHSIATDKVNPVATEALYRWFRKADPNAIAFSPTTVIQEGVAWQVTMTAPEQLIFIVNKQQVGDGTPITVYRVVAVRWSKSHNKTQEGIAEELGKPSE